MILKIINLHKYLIVNRISVPYSHISFNPGYVYISPLKTWKIKKYSYIKRRYINQQASKF